MAIVLDNSAIAANTTTTTTVSWSHTISSNTNGILIVMLSCWLNSGTPSPSSVKWGTTNLTNFGGVVSSNGDRTDIWYLLAPSTGTQTITVTFATASECSAASASYTGVAQTSTFGTIASASNGTAAKPMTSISITSSSSTDLIITGCGLDSIGAGGAVSASGFTTVQQNGGASPDTQAVGLATAAGTGSNVSAQWTWTGTSSNSWSEIGVAMHAAAAGGATNYHLLTLGGVGS